MHSLRASILIVTIYWLNAVSDHIVIVTLYPGAGHVCYVATQYPELFGNMLSLLKVTSALIPPTYTHRKVPNFRHATENRTKIISFRNLVT